ncbi:hypothetical protein L2E82_00876 [Cichorium intybus]|uniref:Uncharacterized protein n=1 Tax=Cichorium intybus TaxID=13427 RepID=A0ACB9GY62_CICIN|nr:hypothetical protein L2E82_00876 [Cichorium intybus]
MSRNLESPVQTQMALSVFKSPVGRKYHGNDPMEGVKTTGRRCVFIQTESGCVLGMTIPRSKQQHSYGQTNVTNRPQCPNQRKFSNILSFWVVICFMKSPDSLKSPEWNCCTRRVGRVIPVVL